MISPIDASGRPNGWYLVPGEVDRVHIDESAVENGSVDMVRQQSLARCGYMDFTWAQSIASRDRPVWP